ncbi:hypothetical protein MTT09_02130 [Campylobacter concisus]|uniref:hypothetical protein n=1 Tax=Campylobacter concisus TaxID=199 RepID=UPI003D1C35AA
MYKILEILPQATNNQEIFILDHGKSEYGTLKYKDTLTSYEWNIKRYNKLKVGAFVLNRHPCCVTKNKKFEIYAGGYVESISEPDAQGNVTAKISHVFNITPPLRQGDAFLENFKWESKNKRSKSWQYFWSQFGMNQISFEDFLNLTKNLSCLPIEI